MRGARGGKRSACILASLTLLLSVHATTPAGASTDDPYRSKQWGLDMIHAEDAWSKSTGAGALVAVVDSGVDLTHPDLVDNIVSYKTADFVDPCKKVTANGRTRCEGDGPQDEYGHGTGVAGIIAAVANNGIGIAGVAPDAKILPVRVIDPNVSGSGTPRQIADGIRFAADKGADVINISLGEPLWPLNKAQGIEDQIYPAIDYALEKGAFIAISAGNFALPLCEEPAGHPGVVCVGAVDARDQKSWFSDFDAAEQHPTYLVAPGGSATGDTTGGVASQLCDEDVYSTFPHTMLGYCSTERGYEASGGTSEAAPHVAGVAALLAAQGLTNTEIAACLRKTSDDLGAPGKDPIYGWGRVNALKAVTEC